ncbi:hypothetical protein LCGC14_2687550 [marine sediment metagenome]|uniref:HTH cro/C1-type domain-containing protein n=1 Tax=marine sediment metagenome TaxID=412755 RepID=A0A0F8ZJJ3_9ZZZZ
MQFVHADHRPRPTGRAKRRYVLSPMTGRLIQDLLEERGLKHKDLAAQVGYEVNYISNVVSKDEASTRFLVQVEKALGLDAGSLVQWNLLKAINKICRKEGISLDDAVSWLERAVRTFRHIGSGDPISASPQALHDPQDTSVDSQGEAAEGAEKVSETDSFGIRSLMSTWGVAFPAPPALFICRVACLSLIG